MTRTRNAFLVQLRKNLERGPYFEPNIDPNLEMHELPVRVLAFYLPQFHPIAENDAWWGSGFTEWTNVTKALPRFEGHYQPHLPGDLGFYDLRLPDVLHQQAAIARRYGVSAFCFHHYWFGGRRLLEGPLNLLLAAPEINIQFCVSWANESWSRSWDGSEKDVLITQQHSAEDDLRFARHLEPLFADPRYVRLGGRPLLIVYRPSLLPDAKATLERWREHFQKSGAGEPFMAMVQGFGDADPRAHGFDAAVGFPPLHCTWKRTNGRLCVFDDEFNGFVGDYNALARSQLDHMTDKWTVFPGVCPSWDNEARRPGRGVTFTGASPAAYRTWLEGACRSALLANKRDERLVFINAWNEWAEGAHLEPDRHFGYAFLRETAGALKLISELQCEGKSRR